MSYSTTKTTVSTKGISEYKGAWTRTQVIHLLKRTMFGAKQSDIDYFLRKTLSETVDELLKPQADPSPPLNYYETATYQDPQGIKLGETWINAIYGDGTVNSLRRNSYKRWWIQQLANQQRSIHEKMILFWHNHFASETADVDDARFMYKHHMTLRKNALGNFKTFVREITVDPAMLRYLNGERNTKTAPDENYARELQELFCIGKGPDSKYTEGDVKAAARVLTGFRNNRDNSGLNFSFFDITRHDTTDKQFSAFYGNKVVKGMQGANAGELELDELLNMIFAVEEVSKYIVRRIYTFFVYYAIDSSVEQNVIAPLAKIFRDNKFEIKPVLSALFKSEHFNDSIYFGASIKSPLDLIIGNIREFNITLPSEKNFVVDLYNLCGDMLNQGTNMQQNLGDPPNVAGWSAYYQEPGFYELWVNSDTFPKRNQFSDTVLNNGYTRNQQKINADLIAFARGLKNPEDPNLLIEQSLEILYRIPLAAETINQVKKDILLSGQSSDYYWTEIWEAFLAKPNDTNARNMVLTRLKNLYRYFVSLPEYQLA
ncbi:MAG: DUF1800 family protein [Spirosomataceae bacterium]